MESSSAVIKRHTGQQLLDPHYARTHVSIVKCHDLRLSSRGVRLLGVPVAGDPFALHVRLPLFAMLSNACDANAAVTTRVRVRDAIVLQNKFRIRRRVSE